MIDGVLEVNATASIEDVIDQGVEERCNGKRGTVACNQVDDIDDKIDGDIDDTKIKSSTGVEPT